MGAGRDGQLPPSRAGGAALVAGFPWWSGMGLACGSDGDAGSGPS